MERRGQTHMLQQYKTVYQESVHEIIEKKSRFIANVFPVKSPEDAAHCVEQVRKRHAGANHHCFAYVLGEQFQTQRCVDDGEPSQTAGKPILDVLLGKEIHDTLIVVTRYFGGTLLGTGGLVRAYGRAAKEGLLASTIITKVYGGICYIKIDYNEVGKVQYLLGQEELLIVNSEYSDVVKIEVLIPAADAKRIQAELIEKTNGKIQIEKIEECYFARVGKAVEIFSDS